MSWGRDVMWAAGLFEGEGTFSGSHRGTERPRALARIAMTDEDSLRRFHEIVGLGNVTGPHLRTKSTKPIWIWGVSSTEDVQAIVAMLWDGLGRRRKDTAKNMLERVDILPARGRSHCRRGHSDWYHTTNKGRPTRSCRTCQTEWHRRRFVPKARTA